MSDAKPSLEKDFEFRPLVVDDLLLLRQWLLRPHLQKWWREGDVSLKEIRRKYLPRIVGNDDAKPFIAYLCGQPVGYIQYYDVSETSCNWWPDDPGPGVRGIDQFIADPARLGKGLGTAIIRQFVDLLMEDASIVEIRVDPRPDNVRAIACYKKVGFKTVAEITNPDGPALMMGLRR